MGKPTDDELAVALAEAGRMREQGEDDFHLAKCLLNHNHRLRLLEDLYHATTSYLHGESGQQHARLVKAVEAYRAYDQGAG